MKAQHVGQSCTAEDFEAQGFTLSTQPGELRLQIWISLAVAFGLAVAGAAALAPLFAGTA